LRSKHQRKARGGKRIPGKAGSEAKSSSNLYWASGRSIRRLEGEITAEFLYETGNGKLKKANGHQSEKFATCSGTRLTGGTGMSR